jgi:hypothetical protein
MRTWARATGNTFCGLCAKPIATGAPVQLVTFGGNFALARPRLRCEKCAEGDAPPDLPALIERRPALVPMVPLVAIRVLPGMLPLDWKARSAGEDREPGEEG